MRAALPRDDLIDPPFTETDAALMGDLVYDEQLDAAEAAAGEAAWGLVLRIRETAGESSLAVEVILAPQGPMTPFEDVWSAPVVLARLPSATRESIRDRVAWARHTSKARRLRPVDVDERRILARPGFQGTPEALPLLLAARLRLASLAMDEVTGAPVVSSLISEGGHDTLSCEVHVAANDGRKKPIVVEIFSCDGAPSVDSRLVAAARAFCDDLESAPKV